MNSESINLLFDEVEGKGFNFYRIPFLDIDKADIANARKYISQNNALVGI